MSCTLEYVWCTSFSNATSISFVMKVGKSPGLPAFYYQNGFLKCTFLRVTVHMSLHNFNFSMFSSSPMLLFCSQKKRYSYFPPPLSPLPIIHNCSICIRNLSIPVSLFWFLFFLKACQNSPCFIDLILIKLGTQDKNTWQQIQTVVPYIHPLCCSVLNTPINKYSSQKEKTK